ncbi:MAG: shikimate dehydrogenase [Steroidobacteraceae bacterium]
MDQYGVIGHPVAHSWSPFIHATFARQTGQTLDYRLHDVPPERFFAHVLDFAASGGCGLNVTVPHKVAAARLSTELSGRARRAGAVNTLKFDGERVLGDNTDGAGLVRDLCGNLGLSLAKARILLAGAGGAARGVVGPLLGLDPAEVVIAARAGERARALAADFPDASQRLRGCAFGDLDGLDDLAPRAFDLVINATSASLSGEVPAVPETAVGATTTCYDMAYGRSRTPFERWALERGCERAVQGWGMLVEQAAESFLLWRGVRPDTAPVLALLTGSAGTQPATAS